MTTTPTAAVSSTLATHLTSALLVAFALLTVMLVLQENGLLLSSGAANYLHELTHDARHAVGVPCH